MPAKFFNEYISRLTGVLERINGNNFEEFVALLDKQHKQQANIFIFGNGGSASTASHFACDINKGVSYGKENKFKVICLNDNLPTILSYANDISFDDVFVAQLKNFIQKDDLVIGISGSGNSENVIRAISYADKQGVETFGFCGFGGGKLKDVAKKSIVICSEDMQKIEDAHFIILHCAMQCFM